MSLYVLAVVDDTPYHEGVEYWYRGSLTELMEIVKDNWSWIAESGEYFIYRTTLGKKEDKELDLIPENPAEMFGDETEENPLYKKYLEEKDWKKGEFFSKIDTSRYEVFPEIETEVKICSSCEIFYTERRKCAKCKRKLQSLDDKVK